MISVFCFLWGGGGGVVCVCLIFSFPSAGLGGYFFGEFCLVAVLLLFSTIIDCLRS